MGQVIRVVFGVELDREELAAVETVAAAARRYVEAGDSEERDALERQYGWDTFLLRYHPPSYRFERLVTGGARFNGLLGRLCGAYDVDKDEVYGEAGLYRVGGPGAEGCWVLGFDLDYFPQHAIGAGTRLYQRGRWHTWVAEEEDG